jgi:hypothetical protein
VHGHEYEKDYRINFLVNNNVDAKFDLASLESPYILHMCGKFGANRNKFFVIFCPLTHYDLDLDQM